MPMIIYFEPKKSEVCRIISSSDEDMAKTKRWNVDQLEVPLKKITRARAKRFKEALNGLIQDIQGEEKDLNYIEKEPPIVQVIQIIKGEFLKHHGVSFGGGSTHEESS